MPPKRPNDDDDKTKTPRRPSPYRPPDPTNFTPRIARQTHRRMNRGQRVKKLGEVLLYDLRGIVQNSLQYFKKNVLPEIPGVDLFEQSRLLAAMLRREGIWIVNGRWLHFSQDPEFMRQHEDDVFVKLKDIWDAVLEKSKGLEVLKPLASKILVRLTAKPRNHGKGTRSSRARPDLLFEVLISRIVSSAGKKLDGNRYLFGNIVAFVEAKKYLNQGTQYQNIKQMVVNANFLLCEDPTRRAVICFSAENTDMRIWVFTRAGVMVSEAFNFITDQESLIHIFLSIAYATADAVGFNTKMTMIESPFEKPENSIQYEIKFGNRLLRTMGVPLSDFKADFFMGRCTRVVKAQDVQQAKPAFALRTSWLPVGSKMEHERLAEISVAMEALDSDLSFDPKRYWLTVELSGFNMIARNGTSVEEEDTTTLFAREHFDATKFYPGYTEIKDILSLKTLPGSGRNQSTGHIHEESKKGSDSGLLHSDYTGDVKSFQLSHNVPRVHYYIGYKEICEPLHSQSADKLKLYEVFYALADAVFGLWALHKAGYVHRDISTGNILYYRVNAEGVSEEGVSKEADGKSVSKEAAGRGVSKEAVGRGASKEAAGRGASKEAAGRGASKEAVGKGASKKAVGKGVSEDVPEEGGSEEGKPPQKVLVKIADLEYMRKMTDTAATEDVKTGTLQFTSVELQTRCYQFWTEDAAIVEDKSGLSYKEYIARRQQKVFAKSRQAPESTPDAPRTVKKSNVPPRYNGMHDLESLFWIAIWFLCYHVPVDQKEVWEGKGGNAQLDMAFTVFVEHYSMEKPPSNRLSCLTSYAGLMKVLDTIPGDFEDTINTMTIIRTHLETFYRQIENRPEAPSPYTTVLPDDAYDVLEYLFRSLGDFLAEKNKDMEITRTEYVNTPSSNVNPVPRTSRAQNRAVKKTQQAQQHANAPPKPVDSNSQASLINRFRNASISDNTDDTDASYDLLHSSDSESDEESKEELPLNPDVDLDSWHFVTDPSDQYYNSDFSVLSGDDLRSTNTATGPSTRRHDSSDPFLN